jgi:hypothetical protein
MPLVLAATAARRAAAALPAAPGSEGTGATSGAAGSPGSFGTDGIGGNGGDAVGGSVTLLVRGSTVNILDTANLYADAYAGDGGFGLGDFGILGNGGNATVGGDGGIGVLVTPRFQLPAQLGTLNAGSINGSAYASAGTGSIFGTSNSLGANYVMFLNSTGNIDRWTSISPLTALGAGALQDMISLVGSNVTVTDEFRFQTIGDLSLLVDNGQFHAGTLTLTAGNFVHDGATPTNLGTTFADDVFITTGGDFIADTNWDVTNTFIVDAPGLIEVDNIHDDNGIDFSAGGSISITSLDAGTYVDLFAGGDINTGNIDAGSGVNEVSTGGSINVGNINAGGFVSLDAGTFINGGDIDTGGSIFAQSQGGDIDLNNLTSTFGTITLLAAGDIFLGGNALADGDIELTADGDILMHNATSHQSIDIDGGGYVDGGNLTAGDTVEVAAGESVTLGNLSAGLVNPSFNSDAEFNVGILAGGAIFTGNIEAAENIGLATPGTITTGDINAGNAFMALGHGAMHFGDANVASEIYLADFSMMPLGGTITGGFDPLPILASAPTPTGGSITIGDVNAGKFTAAAGTNLTTGIINSGTGIGLGAGGAISTGDLFAGDFVLANGGSITTQNIVANSVDMTSTGGNIQTNNVTSLQSIDMNSGGNVATANLTAGDSVEIDAVGSVTTGNISAGLVNPSSNPDADYFAVIRAGGAIATGNINAAQNIGLATPGTITTANIDAGGIFMALGHGNMLFGDATASEVFLADFATLLFGGGSGGGGLANCVGTCGTLGADGVVTAPPSGSFYSYLTTEGGTPGAGQLPGAGTAEGATNGSLYTTAFSAAAGDDLNFWFNYVTSDGSGFADYAWATLLTASLDPVATLFTARTQPSGTIVPGQGLPGVEATLNPPSVPIIDGAPVWSPLGTSSGTCFDVGCGFTGWINSTYDIPTAGNYVLRFGVSNWTDTAYQSGMAFSGITIGGVPVATAAARTGGSITIGNVATGKFTAAAGTSLTTGVVNSTGSIDMDAGGAITTGNLFAGSFLHANGGSITTQNIDANSVDMVSTVGNITAGNVDALGAVALDAFANLTTGAMTAGSQISVDAGGAITINGPVITGLFQAAAGAGLTTQAITAAEIDASAVGTANLNGLWSGAFGDARIERHQHFIDRRHCGRGRRRGQSAVVQHATHADWRRLDRRHGLRAVQRRIQPHQRRQYQHHRRSLPGRGRQYLHRQSHNYRRAKRQHPERGRRPRHRWAE